MSDDLTITLTREHWLALTTHAVDRAGALMATPARDAELAIEAADAINKALDLEDTPGVPSAHVLSDRELDALATHLDGVEDIGDGNLALARAKVMRTSLRRNERPAPWE